MEGAGPSVMWKTLESADGSGPDYPRTNGLTPGRSCPAYAPDTAPEPAQHQEDFLPWRYP